MNDNVEAIRHAARQEGFLLFGITPAVSPTGYSQLLRWIDEGFAAEMNYFADRAQAYGHPEHVLAGVRSIVALAMPYPQGRFPSPSTEGHGKIARYAWSGDDYHDQIHPKLKRLCRVLMERNAGASARGVVDTAPLLEREFAQLSGIGWRGKNTLVLNKSIGSYFFLAFLLTDLELPADEPHQSHHCGTCTACLDACPTDAFPQPGVLDARRCISYLTIEHRGHIPRGLRSGIGEWLFGCDVCQEVCPWNRKPSRRAREESHRLQTLNLRELFCLDEDTFRERFRRTPLWRTRRRGVLRNAAIVLGNQKDTQATPALTIGLEDEEAIVRAAAAWALGEIASSAATQALQARLANETDNEVIAEIESSLQQSS